ncbi:ATP-binding cassette domain-containing protein [candidate division KSB3 bacterium]|uniref:ATP-binding cassette domain-containing protein n=1 Tax=candidate division KSB3 bacterium TaxID=2044937 RepID=A0A9D5Q4G5_9BACT|nr:ATP-binding cassette domain-containing protein [candidate division KSB3 bacterium]MBD3323535.1 ATP-binding cassette domain-containing protein [candidate division KSB3 bacterium]
MADTILDIKNLYIQYPIYIGTVRAGENINLSLQKGEVMGLVGESGCGKSTLGFSILRMLKPPGKITRGQMVYHGRDLVTMSEQEVLALRGNNISMIFQDPLTSLNPLFRIDQQFIETIRTHDPSVRKADALKRSEEILERLGISPSRLFEYPHQMSGGMRQRIMIGLGLVLNPDLLIADEPTTSLDVIVEAQFLDLLNELREEFDLTILLITHNLGVVAQLADRITVMYAGTVAEIGTAEAVFGDPLHPYTQGLLASIPNIKLDQPTLETMPGQTPDLVTPPSGCRFHPRCPQVMDICSQEIPPTFQKNGSVVACWLHQ